MRPIDADALDYGFPMTDDVYGLSRQIGIEMVKARIAEAPTIEAGAKWISVKERLPDSQADVLVVAFWHERWQAMIGWHSDSGEKWRVLTPHGEREPGGVTHWMPLPDVPKMDKEADHAD